MTITDAGLENNYAPQVEKPFLPFLEATHPDLPTPIRLVHNTVDVVLNGDNYIASQFGFTLPTQQKGKEAKMQIQVPNVDREITDQLRTLHGKEEVALVLTIFMEGDLVNPHYGPLFLDLKQVKWDSGFVTGTLGNYFMDQKYPYPTADNTTLPGMVPG
ncbi:MAG: hypothetical protein COB49_00460 [Alphaproteobacteria bacterium]|nr:MAG: hypothetical protein COB49_00460 [Alphaproteobacteria bacterium]